MRAQASPLAARRARERAAASLGARPVGARRGLRPAPPSASAMDAERLDMDAKR